MDKTPLRMCKVCLAYQVSWVQWLMGRRACRKCMDNLTKESEEESVEDIMKKVGKI